MATKPRGRPKKADEKLKEKSRADVALALGYAKLLSGHERLTMVHEMWDWTYATWTKDCRSATSLEERDFDPDNPESHRKAVSELRGPQGEATSRQPPPTSETKQGLDPSTSITALDA